MFCLDKLEQNGVERSKSCLFFINYVLLSLIGYSLHIKVRRKEKKKNKNFFDVFSLNLELFAFDVTAHLDFIGKFFDTNFESALDLFQDFGVLFSADKTDGKTFGTESTGSGYSMEIKNGQKIK